MEIIDSLIFTQAFVFGTLQFRNPNRSRYFLGAGFILTGLVFLMKYFSSGASHPAMEIFLQAVLTFSLMAFISFIIWNQEKKPIGVKRHFANILLLASVLVFIIFMFIDGGTFYYWGYVLGISTTAIVYCWIITIRTILEKTRAVIWHRDPAIKVNIALLTTLSVGTVYGLFQAFIHEELVHSGIIHKISLYLIALLIFLTGYSSMARIRKIPQVGKPIKGFELSGGVERIKQIMESDKPYLDPELTLAKMAGLMETDEHELSRLLNEEMQINFYTLINQYRIDTVKEKLKLPLQRKFTIMAAAYESGFNSKSTFYRVFKQYTGITPKEYLERNKQ